MAGYNKIVYHGNKLMLIGTLSDGGTVSNAIRGYGLVSMDAMENQAKSENYYADDEVWATVQGAQQLKGNLAFMQLDDGIRTTFFGQETISGNLGGANATGYADVQNYPIKAVEVFSEGIATDSDGNTTPAGLLTVYPSVQVTGTPTKKTSTDKDSITEISWSASIQATPTSKFTTSKGTPAAQFEFQLLGDQVAKVKQQLASGQFVLPTGK